MSDEYHCRLCSERPRANTTLYLGRLWRPECLATVAMMQEATRGLEAPAGTKGGVAGLRVVDRPRPRRLTRVK